MKYSPRKFNIEYKAKFTKIGKNNKIKAWISQPLTFGCQKIEKFSIHPRPQKIYTDRQGNKILHFLLKQEKEAEIRMNIKTTLWKNKIKIKKEKISLPDIKLFNKYMKNERFLEQTPQIKKLTYEITKDNDFLLDRIKSIFNFTSKNFKYCYPVKKRGVKNLKLNDLKGDCGEYSSLFVTMCRILKIPARNNTGFVISPKHKKVAEHGWASIYLQPYGWIDFDAQYASTEKNGAKKYFGQRNDYRIVFTNGFNIPLKPSDLKTNNPAQALQPLIFISKNNLVFKDEIELKKP